MTLAFISRMAWRETRADGRRLLLFTAAVAVGVAALVAINSFTDNLRDSVRGQSKALLGADLTVSTRKEPGPALQAAIDTLSAGGARARVVSFAGMGYVTRTTGTRLVQVNAVEPGYPYYGELQTEPAGRWPTLTEGRQALVDPVFLTSLGAQVGDTLALGEGRFVIIGAVTNAPGDVGIRSAFGARVWIPARYLAETRLLQFGSRAEYQVYVRVAPGADPEQLAAHARPIARQERARIRTVADDQQNLSDALDRLGRYLGLVAVVALLLGGLGVASAVFTFIRQKLDTIAILRCLGATPGAVFAIYLAQAALVGLGGSAGGALVGVGLQQLLPRVLHDLLPVDVRTAPSPAAIALGIGTGLWVTVIFALLPLLSVRLVPPLAALRRDVDAAPPARDPLRLPAMLALAASVMLLAGVQTANWRTGILFSTGIGGALLVLWAASRGLIWAVRRWFPHGWPYVWRQGLANLYRPANQTVAVVLSLGFGAFLLATLFLVQHNLLRQFAVEKGPARPNLVLFDIQPDQASRLVGVLDSAGLPHRALTPIVPMRIGAINGVPVTNVAADSAAEDEAASRPRGEARPGARTPAAQGQRRPFGPPGAATRREYRSTYRDTLVASEAVVAGRFWGEGKGGARQASGDGSPGHPALIAIEQNLATELGLTVGDQITWDVQGTPVLSRIAAIRTVDWARFEPNFFVVFAPGALEKAPQSLVTLTRVPDATERGRLQRRLAERFPNVTSLDLSLVQRALETLLERISLAIRFMALFSLATGAVVLLGAIRTSRFARLREGALLKTLGATRDQVLRVALAEYLSLGALATAVAMGLAAVAAWALGRWVFESSFSLPALPLALLGVLVVGGTVVVGLLNSYEVVRKTPLAVLRGD